MKKIILSILACAALFIGCTPEDPVSEGNLAVNVAPSLLNFDGKTAGSADVEVVATEAWNAEVPAAAAEWLSITPSSGNAGTVKVKVSVLIGGDAARSAEVIFKAGASKKILTVNQEGGVVWGTLDNPYTCAKACEFCATLADKAKGPKEVYVKGIISKIVEKYGTTYGNATFFISDDGTENGPQFEVYRAYYFDNKKYDNVADKNINVGDQVMVYGMIMNYGGQAETSQNEAYLISLEAGTSPVLICAEPSVVVGASETQAVFAIESQNIASGWTVSTDAAWITDYTKSGNGNGNIEVKFEANTGAERTATFVVKGAGAPDVTLSLTQGAYTEAGTLDKPYTVAEAIAALKAGPVAGNVYVKGIISNTTKYNYGPTYNTASFWISDDGVFNDNLDLDFEAYGVYWLGGALDAPTAAADIKANFEIGDEVLLYGALTAYTKDGKTTYETANKKAKIYRLNWVESDADGVGNVSYPFNVAGAKAFIDATQAAIAAAKAKGETLAIPNVAVGGKASKIVSEYSANYKTGIFWLSDDGVFNDDLNKDFEAYSVYWLENKEWQEGYGQVKVGDDVIVKGQLTAYTKNGKTTYETSSKKAYLYSLNGVTEVGAGGDTPASIKVDGDLSDWASIEGVEAGSFKEFKYASDSDNLYLYFKIKRSKIIAAKADDPAGSGQFPFNWRRYIAFGINTDANDETGTAVTFAGMNIPGCEAGCNFYPFRGSATSAGGTDGVQIVNGVEQQGGISTNITSSVPDGAEDKVTVFGQVDDEFVYLEAEIGRAKIGSPAAGKAKIQLSLAWDLTDIMEITLN